MAFYLNGKAIQSAEQLEIEISNLSEQQKFFIRNDFNEITNPRISPDRIQLEQIKKNVSEAMSFGDLLIQEFAAENVLLGITQAGMTGTVLVKLSGVLEAVSAGSLYEAISRIKTVPQSDYDSTFITAARLLAFVNKIEDYLGVPRSQSL